MKKLLLIPVILFSLITLANAQPVIWSQGFEGSDTATVPTGWAVYNNLVPDTLPRNWNWTVRTAGVNLPGLSTSLSVAHGGTKSIGVSWYMGNQTGIADAWVVTPRLVNVPGDALFSFWMTGGSNTYSDSVSIWITNSATGTPASFLASPSNRNQNIFYPVGSVYGTYKQYYVDLAPYAGQSIYIGFRYNMDVAVNGYFVQLDDVEYQGTVGITQNGTNVPDKFALNQNYPNPFNPSTKINFDLAKSSYVKLTVFNSLGQVVENIFEGQKPAGSYTADFDGRSLSSGTYYYRLETDFFVETKKMQLVK